MINKKKYFEISWRDLDKNINKIIKKVETRTEVLNRENKKIIIVGIARGGLVLAQMLAYGLSFGKKVDISTIAIQLRDSDKAIDDIKHEVRTFLSNLQDYDLIIFTEDLIDSGETINLIKEIKNDIKNLPKILYAVSYINESFKNDDDIVFGDIKPEGWLIFPWDR